MSDVAEPTKVGSLDAPFDKQTRAVFGFWVYLMTDCVLFASLFATYAVLHSNTFGGPDGKTIFSLPYVLTETMALLTSSFTCGLAMIAMQAKKVHKTVFFLVLTFLLGLTFLSLELHEFSHLVQTGDSWHRSAFLSSYFTLVGTHGLHITIGLIWLLIMLYQVLVRGFTKGVTRRLTMFSMFWHFLDIVWIFIFSIVYLLGVAQR